MYCGCYRKYDRCCCCKKKCCGFCALRKYDYCKRCKCYCYCECEDKCKDKYEPCCKKKCKKEYDYCEKDYDWEVDREYEDRYEEEDWPCDCYPKPKKRRKRREKKCRYSDWGLE